MENIQVGIKIENLQELQMSVIGDRINDYTLHFKFLFQDEINKQLNHNNWGVYFSQDDDVKPHFMIDIYTNNNQEYFLIKQIIELKISHDIGFTIMGRYWDFTNFLATIYYFDLKE